MHKDACLVAEITKTLKGSRAEAKAGVSYVWLMK